MEDWFKILGTETAYEVKIYPVVLLPVPLMGYIFLMHF